MEHMQHFPPGILTYPDPSDFDYSTFLQQAEEIPFHDPSHSTSAGTISESSPGQATPPSPDGQSVSGSGGDMSVARRQATQKQRLERRGHTKSRRGCYNCKRRRIKVCGAVLCFLSFCFAHATKTKWRIQSLTLLIVPGDSSSLRPLCQDGLEVRIPLHATNHPPGTNTTTRYLQDTQCRCRLHESTANIALASPPDSSLQLTRHAILPTFPHPVLPPPSIEAGGDLDPRDPMHCP